MQEDNCSRTSSVSFEVAKIVCSAFVPARTIGTRGLPGAAADLRLDLLWNDAYFDELADCDVHG
jgi:hypothetical protein